MAIQIDYFTAPNDDAAEQTAKLEAGPRSESSDVVTAVDIDPGLALGYLNQALTGTPVEEFIGEWPALITTSDDDQKYVLQVDPEFVARAAELAPPFTELAEKWAAVDAIEDADVWQPNNNDLADFLAGFTDLCRRAIETGDGVYCWLWP